MAAAHCGTRIGDALHQFEDDRIAENKARLFEEFVGTVRGHFDTREQDTLGGFAMRARWTLIVVLPEPK